MISAPKSNLSLKNIKILRPKVTKNLTNLLKKFCESPPCLFAGPDYGSFKPQALYNTCEAKKNF